MSAEHNEGHDEHEMPVIIKRVKKVKKHGGHHGGAWKIAYADFVTAMMTFFLLMWLLTLMNKYQLAGVAEYFKKPLLEALINPGKQQNKDKNKEANTEKEKEKNKEKEKFTEKQKEKFTEKEKEKFTEHEKPNVESKGPGTGANESKSISSIKNDLQKSLDANPQMREFKNQLNFQITADGLKIELRDIENKPMFSVGKADFQKYAKTVMDWLSKELNKYPDRVIIIGHTDTVPFNSDKYTNWELSADRANATRRALIKAGMKPERILRIIGVGDSDLLDKANGKNPKNRRIEIVIPTKEAMSKLTH